MIALIVGILAICGFYRIESLNSPFVLLTRIFRYGQGSFIEELIFTVILFRLLEEYAGTKLSFLVVSLLFGLMHLGNDNASLTRSAFISIQQIASLAPFILIRRIWMPWAIHFAWNYYQTILPLLNHHQPLRNANRADELSPGTSVMASVDHSNCR